jgi:hypothetical protein
MPRKIEKPSRASLIASIALHVGAVAAIWGVQLLQPKQITFQTLAMNVVSPPPNVEAQEYELGERESKVEVETPIPERAPTPPPANKPTPDARQAPRPAETRPPAQQSSPAPIRQNENSAPSKGPNADPNSPGGINLEVLMRGLQNDYPGYYQNIVEQIAICVPTQQEGTKLETSVYFTIRKDGTIDTDRITTMKKSGSPDFDLEMINVIANCAARRNRFGPLPKEMQREFLPVQFCFQPRVGGNNCAGVLEHALGKR